MSPFLLKRLSDESLGSRLASGEAAAFDELYRRYVHRLAAYGSHLLGDAAAGDDVAQSTLLKAYGALREGRVPDKMRPWLYRIAHNASIDLVARRRELPSDDVPELASREPEPMAGALVTSLAALPERQRRVYVMRELHGMRIAETAAELGLTTTQVEQALFAARNRLAELLVFGDKLDCVTVQRLAAGPLDPDERRALKTHLRSCPACRAAVGRGGVLGWLSAPSLDWLRGLLVGGAAPAAAKVGAVVATATVAAGVPVAVEHTFVHPSVRKPQAQPHSGPVAQIGISEARAVAFRARTSAQGATALLLPALHEQDHRAGERRDASRGGDGGTAVETSSRDGHDGHDGSSTPETSATGATEPTTTLSGSHGGDGGGGGGGGDSPASVTPTSGGSDGSATSGTSGDGGGTSGGTSGSTSGSDGGSTSGSDGGSGGSPTVTTVPLATPLVTTTPTTTIVTTDGHGSGDSGSSSSDG